MYKQCFNAYCVIIELLSIFVFKTLRRSENIWRPITSLMDSFMKTYTADFLTQGMRSDDVLTTVSFLTRLDT